MPELRDQVAAHPEHPELADALAYLEKRTAMMNYPEYQQRGWPIGSGSVESANKVVVEARLKGPGMHWARSNANPMLSLRNAICSDRWDEAWTDIATYHQQQRRDRYLTRARSRTALPLPAPQPAPLSTDPPLPQPSAATAAPASTPQLPRRPAADHPWRRWYTSTPSRRTPNAEK